MAERYHNCTHERKPPAHHDRCTAKNCEPTDDGHVFRFEVDWDGVARAVPPLRGPQLRPGESFEREEVDASMATFPSYIGIMGELNCGFNDVEGGDDPPPEFVDPDPPE